MNSEVIPKNLNEIKPFSEFEKQLAEMKKNNNSLTFDYASSKGNKEARSHIHSIRLVKGNLDRAKKEAKAYALEYGRKVESQYKEILSEIEAMIEVHEKPIREIEEKEKQRVQAHQEKIEQIESYLDPCHLDMSPEMINNYIHELEELEPTEAFEEFMAIAVTAYNKSRDFLIDAHAKSAKREAEQAELERLRKEKEDRDRKDREDQIAREAAEKAKKEAEESAERARKEAEAAADKQRKEAEAKAEREKQEQERQLEQARREKAEAEAAAARAKEDAAREQKEKEEAEKREAEAREANKKHKAKINNEALSAFVAGGLPEDAAKLAVELIAKKEIPSVTIRY